ncbi:MAG TPA: hypothetical protein VIW68_11815 [Candidatus Sulfotelmatobacter sp.]
MAKLRVLSVLLSVACVAVFSRAQDQQANRCVFFPNQEVRVTNLALPTAPPKDTTAVIATEIEAILHDSALCCGKDSALGDFVLSEPRSLKELAAKLQGRHLLSDGRPIQVNAEYDPQTAISAGLISILQEQRAMLFEWRSHVYVLYGAIFGEERCVSGARHYSIAKLLLLDPRYSDQRRETVFNRETDDLSKVQGLLRLSVAPQ